MGRKLAPKPKSVARTLAPRRERFVQEYLKDLNATRAAIRAGYSQRTAEQQGPRLLGNVGVAAAIDKAKAKRAVRLELTAERVLAELALLAFSDVTHYQVDGEGNVTLSEHAPTDAMRAVSSIKRRIRTYGQGAGAITEIDVELKLWDKPGPLKLAGRHLGVKGFADRLELGQGEGDAPVRFVIEHGISTREPGAE